MYHHYSKCEVLVLEYCLPITHEFQIWKHVGNCIHFDIEVLTVNMEGMDYASNIGGWENIYNFNIVEDTQNIKLY